MRFIDMSDAQKAAVWRRHYAKTDWAAALASIEAEVADIKARGLSPAREEVRLAPLRISYAETLRLRRQYG